jgi:ABC-type molybdate transport system substrate-binding protein
LTDHTEVVLKLKHQQTWVEVLGQCSDYDRVNNAISFAFDDPASMQARMILQLVKICQMKADLLNAEKQGPTENNTARSVENHDNDISHAAKTWSDQFAADFAKKFDKNN